MKILILGATGRTGKLLVEEAVTNGYDVNVLVRDEIKLTIRSATIKIFEGSPADKSALAKAMQGCEAILSTLNISRKSDFPWAALRTPKDFLSATMKNIIELADQLKIKRLITVSAWGVGETKKDLPLWFRWLIDYSKISYAYHDHELQEDLLKKSALSWTAIRPTGLTNTLNNKQVQVSFNNSPIPHLTVSRRNVARFMLNVLKNDLFINQSPTVSEK